jgi:hypothetical protein
MSKFSQYFGAIVDALFFEGTATKRGTNSLKAAVLSFAVSTLVVILFVMLTTRVIFSWFLGFLGVGLFFGIAFCIGYMTNGFEKDPMNWVKRLSHKGGEHE